MRLYDIHVATEGNADSRELHGILAGLGFKDDELVERGLIFDPITAKYYTSCPLIDIHMSLKTADLNELRSFEKELDALLFARSIPGYWHSEFIEADEHLESDGILYLQPLPFEKLESRPREESKKWDIHVAMSEQGLPVGFKQLLIEHGLYFLSRFKGKEVKERFAVFTVQGVNHVSEGRKFYQLLKEWLVSVGAPTCDIKLEITTAMKTCNSPRAIPPTIERVVWR